jgi:hypothetical protein
MVCLISAIPALWLLLAKYGDEDRDAVPGCVLHPASSATQSGLSEPLVKRRQGHGLKSCADSVFLGGCCQAKKPFIRLA